jgi:cytochrome c-type biogenesis protein CcmF
VCAVVLALGSRRPGRRAWLESAERAVYCVFGLLSVGMVTLWAGLLSGHFELRNVADYTSRSLPWPYKLAALWGSQAGSLMLWCWLLAGFSSVVCLTNRRRNRELMPVVIAVLMGVAVFFTLLLSFVSSPFETVARAPGDGAGLNPLLQNPYMVIHPPVLYLGYVSLAVPFAFAMAALATGRLDTEWITSVRRWTILAWLCLGIGILLGARWAYEELGWGGYWAWDPVENAAFIPWLTATAFLHSVMVQERRGMLKVWNMALVSLTFTLALFGTFLTRSGVLSSIHAFGESTLGPYFLAFISLVAAGALWLIVSRLPLLRSRNSLESYLSREAVFLFNNLLLVGLALAVFWGTVFPILSEAVRGQKIAVGQGYYQQVAVPIGLALLFLTGVGPLIAWRKASPDQLARRFAWPLVVTALTAPLLLLTPAWSHWAAGVCFTLAIFVTACILGEYWRGTRVRHALGGVSWPGAALTMVARNRRRYGGYLVHLGVVVLLVGIAGSRAFATSADPVHLRVGQRASVGGYTFVMEGAERLPFDGHKFAVAARLGVFKGADRVATLTPKRDFYPLAGQPDQQSSEVAIDTRPTGDLYAVLSSLSGGVATFSLFVNPLVVWIWVAGILIAAGALIAAWPGPRPLRLPARARARAARRAEA